MTALISFEDTRVKEDLARHLEHSDELAGALTIHADHLRWLIGQLDTRDPITQQEQVMIEQAGRLKDEYSRQNLVPAKGIPIRRDLLHGLLSTIVPNLYPLKPIVSELTVPEIAQVA